MQNIGQTLTPNQPANFLIRGTVLQILSSGNSAGLTVQFLQGSQVVYTVNDVLTGWKIRPAGGFDSLTIMSATGDTIAAIVTAGDVDIQVLDTSSVITNTAGDPVPVAVISGTINMTATNVGVNNTSANPVPVSLVSEPGAPVAVSGTVNIGNAAGAPVPVSLVSEPGAPIAVTLTGSTDTAAIPVQMQPAASAPADQAPATVYANWQANTAYALNAYAVNGGNLYKVTTAGTSAASGGPTGTGTGITDGTVTWAYQNALAALVAAGTRKELRVRNAGTGNVALVAAAATTFANAAVVLKPGDMWIESTAPQAAWYAVSDTGSTANVQVLA